jgi:hypothetical protein
MWATSTSDRRSLVPFDPLTDHQMRRRRNNELSSTLIAVRAMMLDTVRLL